MSVTDPTLSLQPIRRNHRRGLGSVRSDELLPAAELRRRLGWGTKGLSKAQRMGLKLVTFGKCKYALGKSVLEFFANLEAEQHPGGPHGVDA